MERAFLTRAPTDSEQILLSKYLGSFRDGSGNNREVDGSTRADSRQIERCFAELLHGFTTESKAFYDFVVESNESGAIAVRGASVKSKEIKKLRLFKNTKDGGGMRSHLEISNSSAKDWRLCSERGLTEIDFREGRYADKFGDVILCRQILERTASQSQYLGAKNDAKRFFVEKDCVFISILYSDLDKKERSWLVSSFPVQLPTPKTWRFRGSAVIGLDENDETIYEWYALSGSQFKYYPKISDRLFGTNLFKLPTPVTESMSAKASRLFGV